MIILDFKNTNILLNSHKKKGKGYEQITLEEPK